jgi:hypothetical protein
MMEKKKKKDKAPMELLLSTLTDVVRDHLNNNTHNTKIEKTQEELDEKIELEKILTKKGTIDLR